MTIYRFKYSYSRLGMGWLSKKEDYDFSLSFSAFLMLVARLFSTGDVKNPYVEVVYKVVLTPVYGIPRFTRNDT